MNQNRIPMILERDQNNVVGSILLTEDFENSLLKGLKNQIPFRISGGINLSNDEIVYLSINPDWDDKKRKGMNGVFALTCSCGSTSFIYNEETGFTCCDCGGTYTEMEAGKHLLENK